MNKALLYIRVSSKEQEDGYSLDAQEKLGFEYAIRSGLEIVKIWKVSESAWKQDRKFFHEMLDYAKKQSVKNIIFDITDRMTRNLHDLVKIDELIKKHNVTIHFSRTNKSYGSDSKPEDEFMLGIESLVARKYSNDISMKVKMGMGEKVKQGGFPHKAPTGYINDKDNHSLIIDPEKAPLIRKAFELMLSGNYSLSMIVDKLNAMGFTSSRGYKLHKARLYDMLQNPIYYGHMRWHGKIQPATHEPIITQELYHKVQEVMGTHPQVSRKNTFAFNNLITCGICGCRVIGGLYKKKKYTFYHCTHSKGRHPGVPYLRQEKLADMLGSTIDKAVPPDEFIDYILDTIKKDSESNSQYAEKRLSVLNTQRKRITDRISRLYEDKLDNKIQESFWSLKNTEYTRELAAIEAEISELQGSNKESIEDGIKALELIKGLKKHYENGDYFKKAEIVKAVASNHTYDGENLNPVMKKPFSLFAEGLSRNEWRE